MLLASFALAADPPPPSFFNCSSQPKDAFTPVTLTNAKQTVKATMIAYGATVTHLLVKDRAGADRDVLLGWDDATQYCANAEHTYFGATIGRVANRIANCSFLLGGQQYATSCNEKDFDTLHGGVVGWDRRVWEAVARNSSSVTWRYRSPAGEMGFPGAVEVNVTHSISDADEWSIVYSATADARTVVSMTNHAYFNLNANVHNTPTVLEHTLSMPTATRVLEVSGAPDYHLIPTGAVDDIAPGSALDFAYETKARATRPLRTAATERRTAPHPRRVASAGASRHPVLRRRSAATSTAASRRRWAGTTTRGSSTAGRRAARCAAWRRWRRRSPASRSRCTPTSRPCRCTRATS